MIIKIIKMKKNIVLLFFLLELLATTAAIYSCSSENTLALFEFTVPENAAVSVRDIRVRGFTLDWTMLPDKSYEYAIAASYNGHIENYETAKENGKIVLDFTSSFILGGTYKVKNLLAGQEYEIKIFVQLKNMKPVEYLKTKAKLPFIDEAEIIGVTINGNAAKYDKATDSFSYHYLLGFEENTYAFTYELIRGCALYIGGEKIESKEIKLTPYEPLEITAVQERTKTARDYTVYVGGTDNGIPIIIINTVNNKRIESKTRSLSATMKIVGCKDNPMNIGLYDGEIEIRGRGNSSFGMPKKGYNLLLENKTQIFDMAPSRQWLLMANYSDKSLMRNYTAYEFSRDLGAEFAPKMRFVDVILNGRYIGNYVIGERVKIDKGRLDLSKIKADTTDEYGLTGGYVLEVNSADKWNASEVIFETSKINLNRGHFWSIRQPAERNLPPAAYEYIKNYINNAENALFSDNFKDPEKGYRAYIDTASVINWYLVNELYKQVDAAFHTSVFLYKPRGEKLRMGPVWDFDLGGGNADYGGCDDPEGWYVRYSAWISRMFEDEAFAKDFKDRWNYVKTNGYFDVFFKRIDDTAKLLEKSAEMNFETWRILGKYVWPNAGDVSSRTTYQSEIDYLKEWLALRIKWMDKEINR